MIAPKDDKEFLRRNFKGIWIPAEIWLNRDLNFQEKCLLAEISSLSNDDEGCYASNAYFADFFKLSERAIVHSLTQLRRFGLIETTSFDGRRRAIKPVSLAKSCYPAKQNLATLLSKNKEGITMENISEEIDNSNFTQKEITPITKDITKSISLKKKINKKESADDPFFERLIPDKFKDHPKFAEFQELWGEWLTQRAEMGVKITSIAAKRNLNAICDVEMDVALSCLNSAIKSQWRGLFVPKNSIPQNGQTIGKSLFRDPDYNDPNI